MGILGILLLLVLAVVAGFVVLVIWVVSMARGPIDATNAFVANLDDGELVTAYDSLCAQARLTNTLEEFTEQMGAADRITGYTFASAAIRANEETMVSGTIDLDGSPHAVDFGLREEAGTWRVCRYQAIDAALLATG